MVQAATKKKRRQIRTKAEAGKDSPIFSVDTVTDHDTADTVQHVTLNSGWHYLRVNGKDGEITSHGFLCRFDQYRGTPLSRRGELPQIFSITQLLLAGKRHKD